MCVACIIFNPVPLNYLEAMEHDNPHGAGIAWEQDGAIRFMRGLTAKDIFQLQEDKVMTYPYLMHYRWATHGVHAPELTHPFPIGPRALMGELSGSTNAVLIHNGTWSAYDKNAIAHVNKGNYEFPEELLGQQSDTAIAAWLAEDNPDILDGIAWATAVAEMRNGAMEITTRGTWSDKDGNWYSNLNWVPWENYGHYNNKSDEYDNLWKQYVGGRQPSHSAHDNDSDVWDYYMDRVHRGEVEPYSLRGKEDEKLTWDDYVAKYGTPTSKDFADSGNTNPANNACSAGSEDCESWDDYLVRKYGPAVAAEIKNTLPDGELSDDDDSWPEGLGKSDRDVFQSLDRVDVDVETISEDFETVNSWLAKQMVA